MTEHNILVVCKYYSRIRLARLAQLLDLPPAETERHLSDMVVAGALSAKIDRPAGELQQCDADNASYLWALSASAAM